MSILTQPERPVNPIPARHGIRAPRGGCTVDGRLYKGGQFCRPFDPADPHGLGVEAPAVGAVSSPASVVTRLAIFGFVYEAREIPAGECGSVAYRLVKLDTGHAYDVVLNHFGEVTCDCPDFELRRAGTGCMCKHGSKLVELGLVPASKPPATGRRADPAREATTVAPARRRRFVPSPEEMAEAARILATP